MAHDDSVLIASGLKVLKRYAAQGETLSYGDLNRELGEPFKLEAEVPGKIGKLCDDITTAHSSATSLKLMISVLVRDGDTGLPCDGFYTLAAALGRLAPTDDAEVKRAFVKEQERRVFMVFRPTKASTSGFAPNH
jgi:hypothetical protein